jgi:DNA-directed RNA polymerase specialized sigma24 family protein
VEDTVQEVCMRWLVEQRRCRTATYFRTWRYGAVLRACKAARQRHAASVLSAESAASRAALELADLSLGKQPFPHQVPI